METLNNLMTDESSTRVFSEERSSPVMFVDYENFEPIVKMTDVYATTETTFANTASSAEPSSAVTTVTATHATNAAKAITDANGLPNATEIATESKDDANPTGDLSAGLSDDWRKKLNERFDKAPLVKEACNQFYWKLELAEQAYE